MTEGAARRTAGELRAIAEALATRHAWDALLADAATRLAAVRAGLEALPERPRWYEVDARDRDASRAYHDEFGPLRGRASVVAPPLVFEDGVVRDGRAVVVARARCGVVYEGPPRLVHGGIVAACFDEVLAVVQREAGVHGLTAELTVRYHRPITIDTDLEFVGWIESDDSRTAVGRAECRIAGDPAADAVDGPAAEAEARFVRPRR